MSLLLRASEALGTQRASVGVVFWPENALHLFLTAGFFPCLSCSQEVNGEGAQDLLEPLRPYSR